MTTVERAETFRALRADSRTQAIEPRLAAKPADALGLVAELPNGGIGAIEGCGPGSGASAATPATDPREKKTSGVGGAARATA